MSLRLIALVLLPLLLWGIALVGLPNGGPGAIAGRGDVAAVVTVADHLGVAAWLRRTRRRPRPGLDPEWADVQAERHRRQGTCFAAWGILAALPWFLVRPGHSAGLAVGWPVVLVVAGNFGFQPVVLGALALVVAARLRLGRALVEAAANGA